MLNLYVVIYKSYGKIFCYTKTSTSASDLKKDRLDYYELMNDTYGRNVLELLDIQQVASEQDAVAVYSQFLET